MSSYHIPVELWLLCVCKSDHLMSESQYLIDVFLEEELKKNTNIVHVILVIRSDSKELYGLNNNKNDDDDNDDTPPLTNDRGAQQKYWKEGKTNWQETRLFKDNYRVTL